MIRQQQDTPARAPVSEDASARMPTVHGADTVAPVSGPRNHHQASGQLAVTSVTRRPRAIVVVLGNIGCEVGAISRITKMYHDRKCSTIAATAPALSLAMNDTTTLGELAITVCREAARLVRMAEMSEMGYGTLNILLHVMGNGGAQVVEELERRIREVISLEDLEGFRDDASASSCPLPLRAASFSSPKKNASSKSLLSTVIMLDSEDEEEKESSSSRPWGHRTSSLQASERASSGSSLSRLSLGGFNTDSSTTISPNFKASRRRRRRMRRSPTVERIDMERTGLPPSLTSPRYNLDDRAYLRDMELFAARLGKGCILWDSSPYYPTLEAEMTAAQTCIASSASRFLVQSAIASTHGMHGLFRLSWIGNRYPLTDSGVFISGGRSDQFWTNMVHLSLSKRHAFVYALSDSICDVNKLDDLMKVQQTHGIQVQRLELTGTSGHLDDKRLTVEEYLAFAEALIDTIAGCKLGEEDEEWWSSEDEETGQEIIEESRPCTN